MFTDTRNANAGGKFELGAGYAICAVPLSGGAKYPLMLRINGNVANVLRLDDDQALSFGPWTSLDAYDQEAGAEWLVRMATSADERIGSAGLPLAQPVLLWTMEVTGMVADGSYGTTEAMDVRRYRHVKLAVSSGGVDSYVAQTVGAYLFGQDAASASVQREELGAGTVNNFAAAAGYGYVASGEGLTDGAGANSRRVGTRFNYASVALLFGGGPSTVNGSIIAELWGYP